MTLECLVITVADIGFDPELKYLDQALDTTTMVYYRCDKRMEIKGRGALDHEGGLESVVISLRIVCNWQLRAPLVHELMCLPPTTSCGV